MEKTNSYKKYYEILKIVDNVADEHDIPVSSLYIAEKIGLGRKQTQRCLKEIAEVNDRYYLETINRTICIGRK